MSRGMWSVLATAGIILAFVLGWVGGVSHGRQEVLKDFQNTARQAADSLRQADPVASSLLESGSAQGNKEAQLVSSASNLRYIGKAINAYAASHGGAWPNALSDISSSDELLSPSNLNCPLPGRSYVYRKPSTSDLPSVVVVFERPATQSESRDGINILHRDGSVELITGDEAEKIVAGK